MNDGVTFGYEYAECLVARVAIDLGYFCQFSRSACSSSDESGGLPNS